MAGDLVQHVLQEGNPGTEAGLARTIEIDPDADPGFQGMALDLGAAGEKGRGHGEVRHGLEQNLSAYLTIAKPALAARPESL